MWLCCLSAELLMDYHKNGLSVVIYKEAIQQNKAKQKAYTA